MRKAIIGRTALIPEKSRIYRNTSNSAKRYRNRGKERNITRQEEYEKQKRLLTRRRWNSGETVLKGENNWAK